MNYISVPFLSCCSSPWSPLHRKGATKENENVKKEGANQGKIIMNNTGGNIIYSKQKEQNEDKKI